MCVESDAFIGGSPNPDAVSLSPILNPFGRALRSNQAVWDVLAEDPRHGEMLLQELVDQTKTEISHSFESGADGILYLLFGARGLHATPMEYGGHYLERDREILSELTSATFNMLFVVGEDDAYLDFVSDLPAHAFGWDSNATGVTLAEMRAMRQGALATNSPEADVELRFGVASVSAELERQLLEANAI